MKLYSAWYCPFAQRTWMALKHKGIDFDYVEIDPYDRTDEWMLLSRGAGQVPVISIKNPVGNSGNGGADFTLPDSNRTMEYIETAYRSTGPNLYGNTPIETADIKYWQ
ncbi:MAG: glutathione S-transferase N-terminal domain-containing protein, partial [Kordiimonadaceae bacterium]|nr:glutathione S-transferase N-terminal domain-containing protein [Kordiimonadaceae bacterium]